jgi:hypothetical protein
MYLSYLQTAELVRCIERTEQKLSTGSQQLTNKNRDVLTGVLEDLYEELRSRQVTLC